jgi:hypothetical protein
VSSEKVAQTDPVKLAEEFGIVKLQAILTQ